MYGNVSAVIVEQPASKILRFRYACEGRLAGSIPGVSATTETKTFPSICIRNYTGSAIVIVSCVTRDKPYRPHPHSLVGRDCIKGVCKIEIAMNGEPKTISFPHLGIQCVKKNDVEKMLKEREILRVDPYKTGFKHKDNMKCLDLSVVRLCFQILLKPDPTNNDYIVPIRPIVTDPIYDKKSVSELLIYDISDTTSPTNGGKKIMIFCDKVLKEDIKIRFYQVTENDSWEAWGVFEPKNVHRQIAISFKTPEYKSQDIDNPVTVFMQLVRPSDNLRSESLPFQYFPDVSNINVSIRNKKRKIEQGQQLHKYLISNEECERKIPKMKLNILPDVVNQNVPGPSVFENQKNPRLAASNIDFIDNNWQLQSNQQQNHQQNHQQQNHQLQNHRHPTSQQHANQYATSQQHDNQHLSQQGHQQQLHQIPPTSSNSHYKSDQYYANFQHPYERRTNQLHNNMTTTDHTQNWNQYLPTQINLMNNISGPTINQNSFSNQINQMNDFSTPSHHYITNHQTACQIVSQTPNYTIQLPEIENLSDFLNSNLSL